MGDQTVGLQARLMSQALRKLAGNLNRANTVCIFTNQIREKIGVMFGSPETQPGGRALKFYSSQRIDIRRIETLKEGTEAVGNRVRVKVVKNKVAAPFRQAEFDIEYGLGISTEGCLIDLGIEHGIVQKSGSFFCYGDERLGQGRNNAKEFLRENPEIAEEIEAQDLRGARDRAAGAPLGGVPPPAEEAEAEAEAPGGARARRSRRPSVGDPAPTPSGRLDLAYRAVRAAVISRSPSCGRGSSASRVAPEAIDDAVAELPRDRLPRRCPLRAASSPRTSGSSTSGARSGSPWSCAAAGSRRTDRRRAGRRTTATPSCGPRCCCSASATRGAAGRPRARPRLAVLVRRGYAAELAYEAIRTWERTERPIVGAPRSCRSGPAPFSLFGQSAAVAARTKKTSK